MIESPDRRRLLELMSALSYEKRSVVLSSGKPSNFYVDCKQTSLHPEGQVLIGRLLFQAIGELEAKSGSRFDAVGGLTLGADAIATAIAYTSALAGRPVPAFIVRKEAKKHGTEQYIEGLKNLPAGGRVAVIEDVITTGGSAIKALERIRGAGFVAPVVLALVDRQEGGREAIEQEGVEVFALLKKADFE